MGNNILEPIPAGLRDYLLKYEQTILSNTTPAAPGGNTNVTFQMDQFGHISAYVPTSGGGGATIAHTTSVIAGDGSGNGIATSLDDGITAANTLTYSKAGSNAGIEALSTTGIGFFTASSTAASSAQASYFLTPTGANVFSLSAFGTGAPNGQAGVLGVLNSTTNVYAWNTNASSDVFFGTPVSGGNVGVGTGSVASIDHGGNALFKQINLSAPNVSNTTATSGAASALPTTPQGYWVIQFGGTNFKVPYYNV